MTDEENAQVTIQFACAEYQRLRIAMANDEVTVGSVIKEMGELAEGARTAAQLDSRWDHLALNFSELANAVDRADNPRRMQAGFEAVDHGCQAVLEDMRPPGA